MAKIFSAEQIRLNGILLSGNSNGTIFYNDTQLIQGSSSVPQTFDIVAGDGLSGGGVMNGSSLTLAANLKSDGGIQTTADEIGIKLDGSTLSLSSAGVAVSNVPNALTHGEGISSVTYDGSAAKTVSVDTSSVMMTTGTQTINGLKTFVNNLTIQGDLSVQGTTTTVDSTVVNIGDSIIVLNNDATNNAGNSDGGIEIKRFDGSNSAENASLIWSNSNGEWRAGLDGAEKPVALGKAFSATISNSSTAQTINISSANFASTPKVTASVKNTVDSNADIISCMVTAASSTSVTVDFSAPTPTANYVLEIICLT